MPQPPKKTGTDALISSSWARSQGRAGPVGPHGKACCATGDIETDYLSGEIVLLGRIHAVATPANELLQRLARELAVTRDAPGATPAAAILQRLEKARTMADASFV